MGQMFEIFTRPSGRAVGVFQDCAEAERWLNEVTATGPPEQRVDGKLAAPSVKKP